MQQPLTAPWHFHLPVEIHFGAGRHRQLGVLLTDLLHQNGASKDSAVVLLHSPGAPARPWFEQLLHQLKDFRFAHIPIPAQPSPDLIQGLQAQGASALVACGGGSVMDAAKALRQSVLSQRAAPLPLLTLPTTSGSGSEVTPFAALWEINPPRKLSLECAFPSLACVDPELALTQPPELRLSCGLDAVVQALEALWNHRAQPLSDGWALQALRLAIPALLELQELQSASQARNDARGLSAQSALSQASLLAGLAIAQTRTALCHSISYPLSARLGVPHGLACAFSLPEVWHFNAEADDGRLHIFSQILGPILQQSLAQLHSREQSGEAPPHSLSPDLLPQLWTQWLRALGLSEHLRPFFKACSTEQAQSIVQELNAPERAGRNLRKASAAELQDLFRRACQRWQLPWPEESSL